jgi:conjugal transfer pilus assembly protein TraL
MNEIDIPRYVDSQHQMFFWELDEVVIIASIIGLGMLLDYLFYSMIPAIAIGLIFSRYKNGNLEGVLMHMAFWAGFVGLNKYFPNGQSRNLIP